MTKKFLIFVLSILAINCLASDTETNEEKAVELTSGLGSVDVKSDSSKSGSDLCSQKCSKEIEELKKNMTELHALYVSLQSHLEHLSQHITFHENALKHIANWGHKPSTNHNSNGDNQQNTGSDDSSDESDESNEETKVDLNHNSGQKHDQHTHDKHNQHIRHNHQKSHHNNQCKCGQKPCPECSGQEPPPCNQCPLEHQVEENVGQDPSKKGPVADVISEERNSKPIDPDIKVNETIALNDSQTTNPSEKSSKKPIFPKNSDLLEERVYFETIEKDFKKWFTNMLNEIHSNQRRADRSNNGPKNGNRLDQSAIDEMENTLNSDDYIYATCAVKPNRHVALLNQQDVEGTINLWQLKQNRGPLNMHIKLKGFKHTDVPTHSKHVNLAISNNRQKRESVLLPVEVEPDETSQPSGAPHSHGFHVHEFGNLSRDCQSVGSHYNPLNLSHGGPYDVIRHVGDLGNIRCDKNGEIDAEYAYSQVSLSGMYSILNRSLVIHALIDDYGRNPQSINSKTTGSTGVRIACCVIEEVKQLPKEPDTQSNVGSVASPTILSRKKRIPFSFQRIHHHKSDLSDILEAVKKYETDRKYKTSESD